MTSFRSFLQPFGCCYAVTPYPNAKSIALGKFKGCIRNPLLGSHAIPFDCFCLILVNTIASFQTLANA